MPMNLDTAPRRGAWADPAGPQPGIAPEGGSNGSCPRQPVPLPRGAPG
jgi:hypothetical protein